MNPHEDQIWAYLHNELSPEDIAAFELALENDAELREALEARRLIHGDLEHLLPILTQDDAEDNVLEAQLLEEWEAEHPEFREPDTAQQREPNRVIRLLIPLAAAAVILLVAMPLRPSPIDWERTIFGAAPQLRGQLNIQAHYSSSELKGIERALRLAIETEIKQLPEPAEPWQLKIQIQELAAGAIMIELSGHPADRPDESRIWTLNFPELETCIAGLPAVGKQVAGEL